MSNQTTRKHRHSIFCIIPPDMLNNIAKNGTAQQRVRALDTLSIDNTFRIMRATQIMAPNQHTPHAFAIGPGGTAHRTIYDTQNSQNLPGQVVRTEGAAAVADVSVNEAYDGLGHTYDFYWNVFQRDSIDGQGLPLNATVHYGQAYNNAFWNGSQMVFGDGDGDIFQRFTGALDVIGHELTHGVTQYDAGLAYYLQAGALNESISDVFGSLIKQKVLNQTADQADWLIGAGIFTPQVHGVALRSMKAPGTAFDDPVLGKDNQPADMAHFVHTAADNGGVHTNSGIPNHAFYLVASNLGGYAWDKAGRIWYDTLHSSGMKPNAGFHTFAGLTAKSAASLYGHDGPERQAVVDGWNQVGIKIS